MDYFLWILMHIVPIFFLVYLYIQRKYSYWFNLGVPGPAPSIFQLGNVFQISGQERPMDSEYPRVQAYGKIYGTYTGLQPTLTVADHEEIKRIMNKDFYLFVNRRKLNAHHPVMNRTQFFSDGNDWKRLRTLTSPSFSSGKLRGMHSIMDRCVDKLMKHFKTVATSGDGAMNTKELIIGFTMDVVAATMFATDLDSNSEGIKRSPMVRNALNFAITNPLQTLCYLTMPKWFNKLVGVRSFFNEESVDYFTKLSEEILRKRLQARNTSGGSAKYNDLVQLLIDAVVDECELNNEDSLEYDKLTADMDREDTQYTENSKSTATSGKGKLTEDEIVAQLLMFFSAGFETTASAITNCIYELTQYPDIQERLHQELNESLDGLDPLSDRYFDVMMNHIPYLDAVVKETLRRYSPIIRLERRLEGQDEYKIAGIPLKRGQLVEVATYAVHYSPEYYPEPHRFNPDRFMPENKHLLYPSTYLPFGAGPRNCVGMRFAYQEVKVCLAKLIRQFRFSATADTPSKLTFEKFKMGLLVKPFPTRIELR